MQLFFEVFTSNSGYYIPSAFILLASKQPYTSDGSAFGLKPADEYDAKIFIARGSYTSLATQTTHTKIPGTMEYKSETKVIIVPVERRRILRHELREAYFRTVKKLSYNEAHEEAEGYGELYGYQP